jgi:hypothetical protein
MNTVHLAGRSSNGQPRSVGQLALLCDRICPLRLASTLEIMTFEVKTWWKFSSSVTLTRSELKDESKLMAKMPTYPLTAAQRITGVVGHGRFLVTIVCHGRVPGQGVRGQG